ncbi:MAG: D-tyrosyl-tRNA(Tyr) deacylase, partial [Dehalococcoidia bacterium]
MRVVIQRVRHAAVTVDGETVASIGRGLLALVGVAQGDGEEEALRLARKCSELR